MKKFMAVYMAPPAVVAEMMKASGEDVKAEMDAWMAWQEANKAAIVDFGAPLGKTKRVTASGVADAKNDLTGYTIVQADSTEAAAALFKGHPHLKFGGTSVDLVECIDMDAMMNAA